MSMLEIAEQLSDGMLVMMEIFFVTLVGSLILGLGVALLRLSKIKPISWAAQLFISLMRGTPFFVFGIRLTPGYKMTAVLIGFTVNYAAYFAEIYRAGIQAVPVGQYEAAKVLGYNRVQCFVHIILPQVIKHILPPVANETITLVKDTSLAFTLSVMEVFTVTKQLVAAQSSMKPFIVAGIFYYVFNLIVAAGFGRIEKKLNYYR